MRFKEFSFNWNKTTFGNIAFYKKGPFGSALKKEFFVQKGEDTVKIYEQQNAINKNWKLSRYYVTKEYANRLSSFFVFEGDIIVSCAGTIGELYELPVGAEEGIINQALMRIRVKKEIDKNWFKYSFTKMINEFSLKYSNGSAIKNIPPFSDLKPYPVFMPSINEQIKITSFLASIDQRIETQNKIIEKDESLIKQINNDLFAKEENSKIGDFIQELSKRNKNGAITDVLSVSNKNGFVKQSEQFEDKELASEDKTNYKIVQKGDFAFNPARINVGSIALLKNQEIGIVSPMYICFKPKNIQDQVLESYFLSSSFKKQMNKRLEGSVRMCLTIDGMKNIRFHNPSEKELEILNILSKLRSSLSLNKKILNLYCLQKNYLLSNLFI